MNAYVYVMNNPVNLTDPDGLRNWPWPFNGRVVNKSDTPVEAVDMDRAQLSCVTKSTPRLQDYDHVRVKGKWYKIGPRTFVIDENGNPPSGFSLTPPEAVAAIEAIKKGGGCGCP